MPPHGSPPVALAIPPTFPNLDLGLHVDTHRGNYGRKFVIGPDKLVG